jgi:hypothetical protein
MSFFEEIDNAPASREVKLPGRGGTILRRWVHRAAGHEITALRIDSAKYVATQGPDGLGDDLWRARLIALHTREGADPNSAPTFSQNETELRRIMGLGENILNELIAAIEEVDGHGAAFLEALKKSSAPATSTSSAE